MSKKSFDEFWAEEEAILKMSLEVSRRNRAERLNKSPGRELINQTEGRNTKNKDWWDKIPNSKEYGTTKYKQPTEGNHIKKDAYDDRKKK